MALFSCCFIPHSPDPRNWNKIIKKHLLDGNPEQAILTYKRMQHTGFSADNFTYPILLKAIARLSLLGVGLTLHGQTIKTRFCHHPFVETALLNMYSTLNCIDDASKIFEHASVKDLVSWNSMLDAYASCGQIENALKLFDSIPYKDLLSYNIMVSGYANTGRLACARRVFDEIPVRDVVSWNSMILACTNVGDIKGARKLFEKLPETNVVTLNIMVMAYLRNRLPDDAIALFEEMKARNFEPDHLTITGVSSACAQLGSLDKGREVHIYAQEWGLTLSPHVTTSLIDMYAKCGSIQSSLEVFYKSPIKDIYCWNAIISGLALHGYGFAALKIFDDMSRNDARPDDITFIALLSACSHAGLVHNGCELFNRMERDYGITPKLEHYGCMVDLLGRAGFIDTAFQFIETMALKPGKSILGALLGACVNHMALEIGEKVVKLLSDRDDYLSDGEYMMVANLYASCNQWEEANKWRGKMNDAGIGKTAGCSVVEVNGRVYKFLAGDRSLDEDSRW